MNEREREITSAEKKNVYANQLSLLNSINSKPEKPFAKKKYIFGCSGCVSVWRKILKVYVQLLLTGACLCIKKFCVFHSRVCLSLSLYHVHIFIYIVCGCAMYIQNIRLIGDIFKIMSLHLAPAYAR